MAVTIIIGVVLVLAVLVFLRRNEARLEDEAERALPGPFGAPSLRPLDRQGKSA